MKTIFLAAAVAALLFSTPARADAELAPYGSASVDMHPYPEIDQVFDVNYDDPNKLHVLYDFVRNMRRTVRGRTVIVTHGPELRVFARENYLKYQGIVERMKELADDGVDFRMCSYALRSAGFEPSDMHGFITVIPSGFPEIVFLQSQGFRYVNPVPLPVRGVRYLEHPELKKE